MSKNKFGGRNRVLRGGNWEAYVRWCRSAYRYAHLHGGSYDYFGFRLARGKYG